MALQAIEGCNGIKKDRTRQGTLKKYFRGCGCGNGSDVSTFLHVRKKIGIKRRLFLKIRFYRAIDKFTYC